MAENTTKVTTGWVVDRTNQRGNEVHERAIVGPYPRWLAEAHVLHLKQNYPDHFYAVREVKEEIGG